MKNDYYPGEIDDYDQSSTTNNENNIELKDMANGKYQRMGDGVIPVNLTEIEDDEETNRGIDSENTIDDDSNRTTDEQPTTKKGRSRKPKVINSVNQSKSVEE